MDGYAAGAIDVCMDAPGGASIRGVIVKPDKAIPLPSEIFFRDFSKKVLQNKKMVV